MAEVEGWTKSPLIQWLWTRKSNKGVEKKIHYTVHNQTFSFENVQRLSLRTLEGILDEAGMAIVSKKEIENAQAFIDAMRNEALDTQLYIHELKEVRRYLNEHTKFLQEMYDMQETALGNTIDIAATTKAQMKAISQQMERIKPLIGAVALWMKSQDHEALKIAAERWRTGK